jgi:hypothetical protein
MKIRALTLKQGKASLELRGRYSTGISYDFAMGISKVFCQFSSIAARPLNINSEEVRVILDSEAFGGKFIKIGRRY